MLPTSAYQQMDLCSSRPRTAKHLTERKRRARINDSLLQLKSMVFPAVRKDITRHPKMEKADVLEMTVRYLKDIQNPTSAGSETTGVTNYHAGFTECLSEVSTFMASCESIDIETRLRLLGHLADRCSTINEPEQKPDVSRLQVPTPQQSPCTTPTPPPAPASRVAAPPTVPAAQIVTPAMSSPQQFAAAPGGMVLLLQAMQQQTPPTAPTTQVISVRVPCNDGGVLTPPQSPISPEPVMTTTPTTRLTPSPVDLKPSKAALDIHSHRMSPYQKPVRAAEKQVWRPW